MKLVIGTDEAGYGPNLGPLVVTATAWLVNEPESEPGPASCPNLFEVFSNCIAPCDEDAQGRFRVGDSKQVFQSGSGLFDLEQLVVSLTGAKRWSELIGCLDADLGNSTDTSAANILPWYDNYDPSLPIDSKVDSCDDCPTISSSSGSKPCGQRSRLIEPGPFNWGCDQFGNKATLLSHTTLSLVVELIEAWLTRESPGDESPPVTQVIVLCDKHGGRSRYAAILQELFAESWIRVLDETPEFSRYSFELNKVPVLVEFRAKGESELPIAVASMFSKYLREVSMLAFNRFWQYRIPGLKPTAGYPVDARRFRKQIESAAADLGLQENDWWRAR